MANILILRDVNTSDKDIKTGVAEVELENGKVENFKYYVLTSELLEG